MSFYDFICKDCGREANIRATISEKSEKRVPCPSCGSYELETAYKNAPYAITKSAKPECPNRHVCGAHCEH